MIREVVREVILASSKASQVFFRRVVVLSAQLSAQLAAGLAARSSPPGLAAGLAAHLKNVGIGAFSFNLSTVSRTTPSLIHAACIAPYVSTSSEIWLPPTVLAVADARRMHMKCICGA